MSQTENATEHSQVAIHCSLESVGSPASLFSVTWYRERGNSGSKMLVHLQHDGLLEYGEESLGGRLHCSRASPTDFVLKLHQVEMEDAGTYWCRVAEWRLHGDPSKWVNQASNESQRMVLTVLPSGNWASSAVTHGQESLCPPTPNPHAFLLSYIWSFFRLKTMYRFPKER